MNLKGDAGTSERPGWRIGDWRRRHARLSGF